ncbi:protein argonaute 14-like [Lutra lutra]|uniref:protein argonaute 14-like n=1 Tax=Lutra lutra TaxID=9657 RepID=UPI001FD2F9CD|nr:protein argonaute 14-like [Lutra lutra]
MDPVVGRGRGEGGGERRRRGPAFFFIPASSFPPLVRAAAERARSRPRVSAGARSGPVTGARPPRTGPSPSPRRLAPKLLRGRAAGPDEPPRRAEDPRPSQGHFARPARPGRRDERPWRHCFGRERVGPTRFAPPESPRMRDLWGGAAGRR